MTHYAILEISQNASSQEIKSAYRLLVKKFHPDINPAPDAHHRMSRINEAYEILSNYHTKYPYDLGLSGTYVAPEPVQETEAEIYRKEYLRKKAHQDRVKMENLIMIKVKFYRIQRVFCYLFFGLGLLFTIDYYVLGKTMNSTIESIEASRFQAEITTTHGKFKTNMDVLEDYQKRPSNMVKITYSSIFNVPARIGLSNADSKYKVYETLHSFNNIFSLIILIFSGIVIYNKEYNDFRLTSGLLPVLLILFLLMFVATH